MKPGDCRDYVVKWYYHKNGNSCGQFWYGGCNGTNNRFETEKECRETCIDWWISKLSPSGPPSITSFPSWKGWGYFKCLSYHTYIFHMFDQPRYVLLNLLEMVGPEVYLVVMDLYTVRFSTWLSIPYFIVSNIVFDFFYHNRGWRWYFHRM